MAVPAERRIPVFGAPLNLAEDATISRTLTAAEPSGTRRYQRRVVTVVVDRHSSHMEWLPSSRNWHPSAGALLTAPIPQLWWQAHGRFPAKNAARKQLVAAESLADQFVVSYVERLSAHILSHGPDRVTGDGRQVVQWLSLFGAIQDEQDEAVTAATAALPDEAARQWIDRNEGAIRTLILWTLAYRFAKGAFEICVMADPDFGDAKPRMVVVTDPVFWAMGYANIGVSSLWDPEARYLFGEAKARAASLYASERKWGTPPFAF